jgi:predicted short-subunit dehydrogenase-like oxidoreductase (DUF2520 family)
VALILWIFWNQQENLGRLWVSSTHPLQTFTDIDQAIENLPGSTFAIETKEPLSPTSLL